MSNPSSAGAPAAKPRLRGWLHLGAVPVAAVCGLVLVALAPSHLRLAAAVYALCTVALFSVSATFHRGSWGSRTHGVLQRLDHSMIFAFIAGTYTPIAAAVIAGTGGAILLWVVWVAAVLGMVFRIAWVGAPRTLTVPTYLALGWVGVFFLPAIWQNGGVVLALLIMVGGLMFSAGALVYARRRPDPSPKWFGFHEIFHSCTIGGYVTHYVGVSLAIFGTAASVR